ncbi:MAG: hypothetical protein LBO67_04885 [Spirochaetaceae bacterium]|jgi:chromosome segregation ATPase|nr:hypothetical protein [Spirochaetaceae bacterium]
MIYLAKKNGTVIHHTDMTAMKQIDSISEAEKSVTEEEWEEAGSTASIDVSGEIILGEPEEVKATREEINALTIEEAALQAELDSKDYKVIKASEAGEVLANTDSDLHQRRHWCRSRINEIRLRLAELNVV